MNRLQHESSPYLLQHAHNPVDWYSWGEEAFTRARAEQKPVIVSIGYSTCHWCHVMERESFENKQVAAIMNEHFICIKVDREERPDVDAIYMEACQMITGGGGWPLNCFLTPEGKPFYAGTYFPPRPAHNRPSWTDVLLYLADIWQTQRPTALEQAERLTGFVGKDAPPAALKPGEAAPEAVEIFERLKAQFDYAEGGFGGAPKFPSTMSIRFLLEYAWYYKNQEALQHALFSLEKMIAGGIYDQIGGGFARYATDRAWRIPHFEKMLYDNALLTHVLADALAFVGPDNRDDRFSVLFRDTITETLDWVAREMTHPDGGFYSAMDADSEGEEGRFYVWRQEEIEQILGAQAEDFCEFYQVTRNGNWEHSNILYRNSDSGHLPDSPFMHQKFRSERAKLLDARNKRVWPLLDTKILCDWNALMCSAFAKASAVLGKAEYREIAVKNLEFVLDNLRMHPKNSDLTPQLKHSLQQGYAFLDDYAFFIAALLDVYEITFEDRWLELAGQYLTYTIDHFLDPANGLFYFTGSNQKDIILRKKDLYDNATPSGNSMMAYNLQRLAILFNRRDWQQMANTMLDQLQGSLKQFPTSFSNWAGAYLHQIQAPAEIAIVGKDAKNMAAGIQKRFLPNKILVASPEAREDIPLLQGKVGNGQTLIYLCHNFSCQKPVVSLEEFWGMLDTNQPKR